MKNQIVKSILCLAMTMPFMALADTNILLMLSNFFYVEFIFPV